MSVPHKEVNSQIAKKVSQKGFGNLVVSKVQLRVIWNANGPYALFGFESIEKQLWRNKQNDRPINDSEIKAVLSQLLKTDQQLPPAGHVSEDVTSQA
ncbi:hypothetical protein AVEN_196591-1 [Araneus ventricosus]|uniref:Uncharacterized protein n=1 Tax=Araneus ventricosus TaxID=182803 RepID=A0A4Y2STX1_ARAVE|nr:hypothetical protein AVEN_196591-1 [Araneus ventricosus]